MRKKYSNEIWAEKEVMKVQFPDKPYDPEDTNCHLPNITQKVLTEELGIERERKIIKEDCSFIRAVGQLNQCNC